MRALLFAFWFRRARRTHPELFDGKAAAASVAVALADNALDGGS